MPTVRFLSQNCLVSDTRDTTYPCMAKHRIPLAHVGDQLGSVMQLATTEDVLQGDAGERPSKGAERWTPSLSRARIVLFHIADPERSRGALHLLARRGAWATPVRSRTPIACPRPPPRAGWRALPTPLSAGPAGFSTFQPQGSPLRLRHWLAGGWREASSKLRGTHDLA